MRIIDDPEKIKGTFERPTATIGIFDGVHRGHQALISLLKAEAAKTKGNSVIFTFDPHPLKILAPQHCPPMIQTTRQRLEVLQSLEVDGAIVYPFSTEFSHMEAEDFVRTILIGQLNTRALVIGRNFTFGHRRRGTAALLEQMGAALGFTVMPISETDLEGEIVSSTQVRKCLSAGDIQCASRLLGRAYCMDGTVVTGLKLGAQMGFPTANLDSENDLILPNGVYVVDAEIGSSTIRGVAGIGVRPTIEQGGALDQRRPTVEVHLLDFDQDIYGAAIRVYFHMMLRPERKYGSIDELKRQIQKDVEETRRFFSQNQDRR